MRRLGWSKQRLSLGLGRSSKVPAAPRSLRSAVTFNRRQRGVERNERLPFVPPEDWYEPEEEKPETGYRTIVQEPGAGYRHILTPDDVHDRLAQLPKQFLEPLEVVQLSTMTRKKRSFPCYGMQWGSSLYLYPIEESLEEHFHYRPKPDVINECRMYGGVWEQGAGTTWVLRWSEEAIRDYYLNNILIHELGHLLDDRNTSHADRERYAEWFAIEYGYRASRRLAPEAQRLVTHRHGKKR